ncbi:MAG: hypothetical protein ACI9EF_002213 [Pseudohongiellaceae bacterium]
MLVPSPDIIVPLTVDTAGQIVLSSPWPSGLPSALEAFLQFWVQDLAGPSGRTSSNGLVATVP